jgi:ferredoxin
MSVIKSFKTKEEIEVSNGSSIKEACKKMNVPFGCETGVCGSCMINIVEGEENLNELTEEEEALARDKKHRLACQCKIESGEVEIDF